ncbi:MAG: response regulator transcription factor [Cellulosilyticaceae bacterium]
MNLNIVIADDEYFIRQRLKKLIPWDSLGLTLIGEAANGLEVIDLLAIHTVDLIILDIQMPKMNGIEIAGYIHNKQLKTKIIILSGYNSFDYAQKTLRFGVFDYLLKPIEPENLLQTLSSCIQQINGERQEALYLKRYSHYEKEVHLNRFLLGSGSLSDLYDYCPELRELPFCTFVALFISEPCMNQIDQIKSSLQSEDMACEYFKESESTYCLQVFFKHTFQHQNITQALSNLLQNNTTYTFGVIGDLFYIEHKWLPHHKNVLQALNRRYFYHHSHVEVLQDSDHTTDYHKSLAKTRQKLTNFINSRDESAFTTYIEECFGDITAKADPYYLQTMLYEILLTYTIYYPQMLNLTSSINDYVSNLLDEDYVLSNLQNSILLLGLQCLSQTETLPSDVIMSQKITQYIEQHYTELDLSVAKIAEFFDFNTSYIGTLFKKVTNQSILQYITSFRLEASKHLLDSQKYKVSEIAEMVGYSDVFYYSKRFKKMYGYSPKEYTQTNISKLS